MCVVLIWTVLFRVNVILDLQVCFCHVSGLPLLAHQCCTTCEILQFDGCTIFMSDKCPYSHKWMTFNWTGVLVVYETSLIAYLC